MTADDFTRLTHVSPVLTNEELSKALTKWFNEDYVFTHWEYLGGTNKGDSYLSELIKIKIFGKNKNGESKYVQVVIKNIPHSVSRRLTFRCDEFFRNEISFYKNVLPALLEFQATKDLKEPFNKCTKLFFSYSDGHQDVICLEDATRENFGSAVRQEGIDIEHCRLSFKLLAQFHALSFAMRDQRPEEFENISNELLETYYDDRLWDWYTKFWSRICNIAVDSVEKEYPNSKYLEKVKQFAVPERYRDCVEAVRDTFPTGVISHGDCWISNFLYKYEDGIPTDAKFIDFQLARCGSPILDLSFVVYACTTKSLRDKYYDELLNYYYEVLSSQIKELGSDPEKVYSKETFFYEVKKYFFFGLAFSFETIPHTLLTEEECFDMESIKGEEKIDIDDIWQVQPFKRKEDRLREANNIIHAVDYGYI